MQDFLELPNNLSLFSNCEVSSGKYHPHVQAEESISVKKSCDNPYRKNIITCKDPALDLFIKEVEGLALDTKLSTCLGNLPNYIPVFDQNVKNIPNVSDDFETVGITLRQILSGVVSFHSGAYHELNGDIVFNRLLLNANCFKGSKVILFCSGPDTFIENLWYRKWDCNFFNNLNKMGFYAVSGINFSLINGECALSQSLNQKRSLYSSYLLEMGGNKVIPHLYALSRFHINRWVDWLNLNPNIQYITINCQLQKSEADICQVIQAITQILTLVPYLHVIVQGFRFSHIDEFGCNLERIHFADTLPLKLAQMRKKINFNLDTLKTIRTYNSSDSIEDLVYHNFQQRLNQLTFIRKKVMKENSLNAVA